MSTITDKYLIRDMNKKLVLKTIIQEESISRADIAKVLNLNKTSVSSIVADLLEEDLVYEIGAGESSGGRKPILIMFNKKAGYSLAFDVGPDYISSLLTDLGGNFVTDRYENTGFTTKEQFCQALKETIQAYMDTTPKSTYGITGICMGLHGIVNANQLLFSPFYHFDCQALKAELEEQFGIPVHFENEANLAALGEQKVQPEVSSLVSISVKYGIGAGVILNKTLYTGADGHAGEIGHLIMMMNGRPCTCGNFGCLEQYASEHHLFKEYMKRSGKSDVRFMTFKQDYLAGCEIAKEVMCEFTQYMAIAVNNLITTFNPEVIIINSRITNQIDGIIEKISGQLPYKGKGNLRIEASTLDRQATLVGGIYLNNSYFFGF